MYVRGEFNDWRDLDQIELFRVNGPWEASAELSSGKYQFKFWAYDSDKIESVHVSPNYPRCMSPCGKFENNWIAIH
jgi:hypothetical protein